MCGKNREPDYHYNIPGILAGLLVGGLVGATVMLLLAPQSGKRTRKQIQQKGFELRDRTTEMVEDAVARVRLNRKRITRIGRRKAKKLLHQGQELATEQIERVSKVTRVGK